MQFCVMVLVDDLVYETTISFISDATNK